MSNRYSNSPTLRIELRPSGLRLGCYSGLYLLLVLALHLSPLDSHFAVLLYAGLLLHGAEQVCCELRRNAVFGYDGQHWYLEVPEGRRTCELLPDTLILPGCVLLRLEMHHSGAGVSQVIFSDSATAESQRTLRSMVRLLRGARI